MHTVDGKRMLSDVEDNALRVFDNWNHIHSPKKTPNALFPFPKFIESHYYLRISRVGEEEGFVTGGGVGDLH